MVKFKDLKSYASEFQEDTLVLTLSIDLEHLCI